MNLLLQYPIWYFIIALALVAGLSYLTYAKTKHIWISIFRGISLLLVVVLLLSPMIRKTIETASRPILIVAQDNSRSINRGFKTEKEKADHNENLNEFCLKLSQTFDIQRLSFGEKAQVSNNYNYSEGATDFSELFTTIDNDYGGSNLAAMLVLSDGVMNHGLSPLYQVNKTNTPIFTIGMGDTVAHPDLKIQGIQLPQIIGINNDYQVGIQLIAQQLKGENSQLTIKLDDSVAFQKPLSIISEEWTSNLSVQFQAKRPGVHVLTATLQPIGTEINKVNNSKTVSYTVSDAKDPVLVLYGTINPDLAALRTAIEGAGNRTVTLLPVDDYKGNAKAFSLVIAYQLYGHKVLNQLMNQNTPLWLIGLPNTDGNKLEGEPEAMANDNFNPFLLSKDWSAFVGTMPPLTSYDAAKDQTDPSQTLLYQTYGNGKKFPLFYFKTDGEKKLGYWNGIGFWKWKMREFQAYGNQQHFDELVQKSTTYLIAKENRTPFEIVNPGRFSVSSSVLLKAYLRNAAGEFLTNGDLTISLFDGEKKQFDYSFSATPNGYEVDFGKLKPGKYSYVAHAKTGNNQYSLKGLFWVEENNLEDAETTANHVLLYELSQATGGKFHHSNEWKQLAQELENLPHLKKVIYSETKLFSLIDFPILLALLVLSLTAEWVMRRRNGL